MATCTSSRRDLLQATCGERRLGGINQSVATFPGREAGRRGFPASVPGARFARAFWRITSRWSRAPERSTPRRATARKTTSSAGNTASTTYCPVDAAGRFFHAEGADGQLPEELIGKTVWEGESHRDRDPAAARRSARACEKSSTAIRTAGAATSRRSSAPPSSGSSAWIATISGSDALDAIRKVKWLPAWGEERIHNMIATRPDWCISRQRVWGVPIIVFYCDGCREPLTDRKVLDGVVTLFAEHSADIWYERTAAELLPAGHDVRQMRRHGVQQRERHSRRLVRLRFEPSCRAGHSRRTALAGRHVSRGRRPVSRLVPQFAAGRRRAARAGALSRVRDERLDARRRRPGDVEVARQRRSSPRRSSSSTARKFCGFGSRRSNTTRTFASRTRSSRA